MKKVCLVSLGCPKNLVDSEEMLGCLSSEGWSVVSSVSRAHLVILNTCAFLAAAVAEAEAEIARLCRQKRPNAPLLVVGCYPQRSARDLARRQEIAGLVGTGDPSRVIEAVRMVEAGQRPVLVGRRPFSRTTVLPRLVVTRPYAYLKISEGCSNACRYCLIPRLRGPLRSRSEEEIVAEAAALAETGIRELVIAGQDTTAYGTDRKDGSSLASLLEKLSRLPVARIRVLYANPGRITDHLLSVISTTPCVCKYLDIPVQHADKRILAAMGRPTDDPLRLFDHIRNAVPGIALRTTVIVGYPGETEREFRILRRFVEQAQVERLGIFAYSPEECTPAARMKGQVPEEAKARRLAELAAVQAEISRRRLRSMVGNQYEILVDGRDDDGWVGRTEFDAPEIDGVVRIAPKRRLRQGQMTTVVITSSSDHDLVGRVVGD